MKKIVGLGIIGFILVVGSISVGATSTVPSDGVLYSDSGKTVKEALDELFTGLKEKQTEIDNLKKIGTASEADILTGKTALVQGVEVKGQMANNGYGSVIPLDRVMLWDNYVYYRIPGGYYPINSTIGYSAVKATYSDVASKAGLTAAKLAKGQTVLGVSGTYTSDATASAANILSGKTAYVNGVKLSGSMADYTGTPQQIDAVRLANGRFEVAVARGYHGYSWAENSYEYLTYTQVANAIGLTAAKLAKGQTVLGIAGTYTSDATASAANILSGKTAYINGSKTTGTMANNGALNWSPSTSSSKTIAAGYYSGGTISTENAYNAGYAAGLAAGQAQKSKVKVTVSGSTTVSGNQITKTSTTPYSANKTFTANGSMSGQALFRGYHSNDSTRPANSTCSITVNVEYVK